MQDERLFKFVLAGSLASGKTSVIRRYVNNTYTLERGVTGVDFHMKGITLDGVLCKLQIWDTAGADRFKDYNRLYFRESTAIILTLDLTRPISDVESVIHEVLRHVDFSECFLIVVGTKSDNSHRKIDRATAELFADKLGVTYLECSAKDNINIEELFTTATKIALLRSEPVDEVMNVYLSFYRNILRFLEETDRENAFAVQKIYIKYCTSKNLFIRQEAEAAVQKMDSDTLVQMISHFRRALSSQSYTDRDEAREGLRHLNQLNTPEVIQICMNSLREIGLDARKRAAKILKEIGELSDHEIMKACFKGGYGWDENVGVKSDAFEILVEIKADHIVADVKNKVLQTLLVEAESLGDQNAVKILLEKHNAVPLEVVQGTGRKVGHF